MLLHAGYWQSQAFPASFWDTSYWPVTVNIGEIIDPTLTSLTDARSFASITTERIMTSRTTARRWENISDVLTFTSLTDQRKIDAK
jgi:hypothetical protein